MFFPEEEFYEIKIRLLMELKFFIFPDRKSTVVMQMDNEGRGEGIPVSLCTHSWMVSRMVSLPLPLTSNS